MKNLSSSIKNHLVSKYLEQDAPVKQTKSTDINVLKSKLQESESKEFKKNLIILSTLIIGLGILGIYLSL